MPYDRETLLAKLESARARAKLFSRQIFDCYNYVAPNRNGLAQFYMYLQAAAPSVKQIYDGTAVQANKLRANQLIRMLMPRGQRYAGYVINPEMKTKTILTDDMLQAAMDQHYYFLMVSNLDTQLFGVFQDQGIGNGALWGSDSADEEKPLAYQAISGFSIMPEYYNGDEVKDYWFPVPVSATYILNNISRYNLTADAIEYLQNSQASGSESTDLFFISKGHLTETDPTDPNKVYRIVEVLENRSLPGTEGEKGNFSAVILSDRYVETQHLYVIRDDVPPQNNIGFGPAYTYLPIIERLNEIVYEYYQSVKIGMNPPIQADLSKFNPVAQGGKSLARMVFQPNTFGAPFEVPTPASGENYITSMRTDVRSFFDINPIGDLEQPVRTATEISVREDANNATTTINASRLQNEGPKPIFESSFQRLLRRGLLPNSEVILSEMKRLPGVVVFQYRDPMQDIQNNNYAVSLQRTMQAYQQYMGPESIICAFKLPALQNFMAGISNLPANLFMDGDSFEQHFKAGVQAQANANPSNDPGDNQGGEPMQPGDLPTPTTAASTPQPLQLIGANA